LWGFAIDSLSRPDPPRAGRSNFSDRPPINMSDTQLLETREDSFEYVFSVGQAVCGVASGAPSPDQLSTKLLPSVTYASLS
jgi:hypothetical protein